MLLGQSVSLKLSYASPKTIGITNGKPSRDSKITFETSLIKHTIFQPAIYLGISREGLSSPTTGYLYGAAFNVQLLPLFIEKPLRLQVYSRGEFGGNWIRMPVLNMNWHSWEYGIGAGASLNLNKRLGLFTECTYG